METLLNALNKLYSIPGNSYISRDNGKSYFEQSDIVEEVESLCDEFLIAEDGRCNWNNIEILRNNGYRVYAGEKDSFGWLTGCVQRIGDPRTLVYG